MRCLERWHRIGPTYILHSQLAPGDVTTQLFVLTTMHKAMLLQVSTNKYDRSTTKMPTYVYSGDDAIKKQNARTEIIVAVLFVDELENCTGVSSDYYKS